MNFKKSVVIALLDKGKSQEWLKKKLGLSGSSVSKTLTNNNPDADRIQSYAEALDMKASELIALGE